MTETNKTVTSGPVKYLDDEQANFIEQCEDLLQRAREGKVIGMFGFEFTVEHDVEPAMTGMVPDDLVMIAGLHSLAADLTADLGASRALEAMGDE